MAQGSRIDEARAAIAFLTRLPVGGRTCALPDCAWAFPLAGLLAGLAGALVWLLAGTLNLPAAAAGLLALAAMALLTGALHEDGLADMADGLGGSTRERRLDIMRDSRIGSFGVLALIFALGLKLAALLALPGEAVPAALVAAAGLSRALAVALLCLLPAARVDGLGASAAAPAPAQALVALGLALLAALALFGPAACLAALFCAGLAAAAVAVTARRAFGGQTGDVLGAQIVLAETAALLALAAIES